MHLDSSIPNWGAAYLVIDSQSTDMLMSYLSTYSGMLQGSTVSLLGKMYARSTLCLI